MTQAISVSRSKHAGPVNVHCATCGNGVHRAPYLMTPGKLFYCSNGCRGRALSQKIELTCQHCSKCFMVKPAEANTKYCGWDCKVAFSKGKGGPPRQRITVACRHCGKNIEVKPSRIARGRPIHCSQSCSAKAKLAAGILVRPRPDIRIKLRCPVCGKSFHRLPHQMFKSKRTMAFCSKRCSSWVDGRGNAPYPATWTKAFKESIRVRDGHHCKLCGRARAKISKGKLHVHHIDHNPNNVSPANLISLCHECHTGRVHANKHSATLRREWAARLSALVAADASSWMPVASGLDSAAHTEI